ncbi:ninein isoform X2 [Periophthalmus magnuspinnatus]|uniref:ninein isoform X2 n=1 Tax=Periophthalmus magnuspinnatus TaxID=409849 RepID=UPI002436DEBE|nr:ninein isoform X2 [Periophthalmus magnuspinnatus]
MGEGQEQSYEEQLRGVFDSFDLSGSGSLSQDELWELCVSLHLQEATPALLQTLRLSQHTPNARVEFEQFKNALILVLSSTIEEKQTEQEPPPKPASPEIQPKFVKGSKRYGRRSTPELIDPTSDLGQSSPSPKEDQDWNYESAVPCKRERWNALETSTEEEYEAEGQLHLWNPDEPGTAGVLLGHLEQRAQEGCEELALSWDSLASHKDLLALCQHLGLEISGEVLKILNSNEVMSVQEFVSKVSNHNKPPTPSASTPYRQLKRMHSTQPFDEGGRRIATPSALSCTIGLRLFSTLDDGTGFTPVEQVLDSWTEEGIENSAEILQALNFSLDGKLSLSDLTVALETELLETKNGVLQAALASFRAEIRHLLACVDRELREKEKIQSDLEKAERLKSQLATEVDEHHSAIEHMNNLNLRKLEQEHKDKLCWVRAELMQEMEQMHAQAGAQRDQLEAQIQKIREEESFLRDHLSVSVKENRRLETELLDTAEKLVEAQNQITKLQTNIDNIMKEKFGELDPGSAEFFLQEERIKQLHISYETQCRELQDRIDELQSELNDFHSIGHVHQTSSKTLNEELESKSPGNESDPGLGSEEVQPFSLSLESEMMLEQLKDRHLQEMNELRNQLENKISEFEELVTNQRTSHEEQRSTLAQQHQEELQTLREEMCRVQTQAEELQRQLEQATMDPPKPEKNQELEALQEQIQTLRQQLLESHIKNADLDEHLRNLEEEQSEMNDGFNKEMEELKQKHSQEISRLVQTQAETTVKMEQERTRLLSDFEKEKEDLKTHFDNEIGVRLDQEQVRFEEETDGIIHRLTAQWQKERNQLDEQNTENLQVLLEEEMLKLVKEQEDKERELRKQWEMEKAEIQQKHDENLNARLHQQTREYEQKEEKLRNNWEKEKAQLEEDFEGMVQERVSEEMNKVAAEREEEEEKFERVMMEERERVQERHQETLKELTQRHREEREELHSTLDKLKEDIAVERSKAGRLSEENLVLKNKIEALKDADLKEMMKTLETLKKEKDASQRAADDFKKQISELQSQSVLLENKNGILCEKNSQHLCDVKALKQQMAALAETKEKTTPEDKRQLSACVSALEAELTKAMDETMSLKQRNSLLCLEVNALREKIKSLESLELQLSDLSEEKKNLVKETQALCNQLSNTQEKVKSSDDTLQAVTLQSSRLKADVRVLQQQKDSLQHEVSLLYKKLQNANDKNHVLERALHSTGLQSHSKRLLREELSRLMEQDQTLLKQENDKLQGDVQSVKTELRQARDKIRQMDSTIVNLKQHKQSHSSMLLNLEQENIALKQELDAQKEKNKLREAGAGGTDMESILQENEALKTQMARLSTQLIETFQAQLVGLLPSSPHRIPRGQQLREEADQGALSDQRGAHADSYRRIGGL